MNIKDKITDPEQKKIYEKYSNICPFRLLNFCKDLKIEVIESLYLPSGVSGFIKETRENKTIICVNEKDIRPKQCFTIAHELGHYFLHRDKIKKGIVDGVALNRDGKLNKIEIEADDFGAELLMPKDLFVKLWNIGTGIDEISRYFNVSKPATLVRASALGLSSDGGNKYFV